MNAVMKVDVNRWTYQQTPNNQDGIRNPLIEGVNATGRYHEHQQPELPYKRSFEILEGGDRGISSLLVVHSVIGGQFEQSARVRETIVTNLP